MSASSDHMLAAAKLAWAVGTSYSIYEALISSFGSIEDAIQSGLMGKLGKLDKDGSISARLSDIGSFDEMLHSLKKCGARMIMRESPYYPEMIRGMPQEPVALYAIGDMRLLDNNTCAIVGSRKSTDYGERAAKTIAEGLASAGVAVVSGMANGIDSVAQNACIESGGRSIGFVAGGIDKIVPAGQYKLYDKLRENGLIISEYPPGRATEKWMFPQRNRLIAGMSDAIVLIEAGKKSGTRSTIDFAQECGKEVFAVPGRIFDEGSYLPNLLIKQGACPATSADDICVGMRWDMPDKTLPAEKEKLDLSKLDDIDRLVVLSLVKSSRTVDELIYMTKVSPRELLPHLTTLEMEGIIEQFPGSRVELCGKYRV